MGRWSHDKQEGADDRGMGRDTGPGVCFDFENKGSCSYGNQCRWRHIARGGTVDIRHINSAHSHSKHTQMRNDPHMAMAMPNEKSNGSNGSKAEEAQTTDQLQQ